jgi:hypothetical protein
VERGDSNAVTIADRHRLDLVPILAGSQRPSPLLQFDRDRGKEAHLAEERLLALRPDLSGDLGCADV